VIHQKRHVADFAQSGVDSKLEVGMRCSSFFRFYSVADFRRRFKRKLADAACRIISVVDKNGKRLKGTITRDPSRRWREFEVFCEHSAVNKEEMMRIERCVRADHGQELVDWLAKHMLATVGTKFTSAPTEAELEERFQQGDIEVSARPDRARRGEADPYGAARDQEATATGDATGSH
jgi:hypothetical protein